MSEIFHEVGEVQAFEWFDGASDRFVLAETGREDTRWIESDLACDLTLWE